ncbi:MAG TPA: DNRLRE domain-containing protein [Candidatus Krumholzibacteria bacterium]|nr:DNRLRE domain-containing protein [Candidatus Krumholzibacteria bacterium]
MRYTLTAPLLLSIFLLTAADTYAASIAVSPDKDNTIYAESDTLSNGGGTRFFAGENGLASVRRGLLRFNLAGVLDSRAAIDSVVLRLSVVQTHVTSVAVQLHRLLADWGEGTTVGIMGEGGGGKATPGSATWLQRFYLAPAALWTTPGGDFVASASASRPVGNIGTYTWRSPTMNGDVAFWLANPAQNFGWEVTGNEVSNSTAKAFGSRQNATLASRPLLTIYYSIPSAAGPLPPVVQLFPVHPNPFNPSAAIRYQLAVSQHVSITVYDATGRMVSVLVDTVMPAGTNEIVWHGDDARGAHVASGVYVVKLVTANAAPLTQKMVLLK